MLKCIINCKSYLRICFRVFCQNRKNCDNPNSEDIQLGEELYFCGMSFLKKWKGKLLLTSGELNIISFGIMSISTSIMIQCLHEYKLDINSTRIETY